MGEIQKTILVGFGGFIGAMLRYLINRAFLVSKFTEIFPSHTIFVNVVGCFLIGYLAAIYPDAQENYLIRLFLLTGILGGFTTFSAFSIEAVELLRGGMVLFAALFVSLSVVAGLLATVAGIFTASFFLK